MNVFKTFLKVLNENKFIVLLYTLILILFGAFSLTNNEQMKGFSSVRPDVLIVNNDADNKVTNNLISYISNNCNIKEIENNGDQVNDALFYREVNYVIYIPKGYGNDFLNGLNPQIEVKSTGDYQASLAEMELSRYLNVASIYLQNSNNQDEMLNLINEALNNNIDVDVISSINNAAANNMSVFYNFANYSILAGAIYVICLIVSSFRSEGVLKRTIVSSTNYKEINRKLLLANGLFALVLWLFYVILSFILVGKAMLSWQGLLCMLNALIFTICALTIAFLLSSVLKEKNAINGIVNVIALGSSFLCGAFVPVEYLPASVLRIAHILPSYYYINSNEVITSLEVFNLNNLKPVFINTLIIILFSIVFIVISNIVSKKKQRIA